MTVMNSSRCGLDGPMASERNTRRVSLRASRTTREVVNVSGGKHPGEEEEKGGKGAARGLTRARFSFAGEPAATPAESKSFESNRAGRPERGDERAAVGLVGDLLCGDLERP